MSNSWETYSKLVLQQLETLSTGIEALRGELQDVKNQLVELKAKEDEIYRLWKQARLFVEMKEIFIAGEKYNQEK